jgi:predicted ATP-grasp superfamily ATP-dependent carboligase
MADNYVLILFGNISGYNIASVLSGSGYKSICFTPHNFKEYSTPVAKFYKNSSHFYRIKYSNYNIQEDEFVDELIIFLKELSSPEPILTFMTSDIGLYFWMNNKEKLSPYMVVESTNFRTAFYKNEFFSQLKDKDIPFPVTYNSIEEVTSFPVIVKPAYKGYENDFDNIFGAKSKLIDNVNDLSSLKKLNIANLVFQQKIDFKEGNEYSWFGYRDENDNIISVTAKHRAKYPDKMGRITHTELVSEPDLKIAGEKIIRAINYIGIADIQFIFDEERKTFKVIEMNPRIWCSHEILPMNGINLIKHRVNNHYRLNDNSYDRHGEFQELEKLSNTPLSKNWYSIMYFIGRFSLFFKLKQTEYYNLKSENLITRLKLKLFLVAKYIGHSINKVD